MGKNNRKATDATQDVQNAHPSSHESKRQRERAIVRASFVGIFGNLALTLFKFIVGFASHSIAIILDGVNNATDALSSIITIVGTKLAGRRPNRAHPFGFGRLEYVTSVIIAVIILAAGVISLRESIDKILHPANTNYTATTITVIMVAIVAKIVIGVYFHRRGKATNSQALIASGIDSDYDAVLSAGTLVVAIAQLAWNINIDGIVGLIISLVVCKAGIEVLGQALAPLIGTREDDKFGRQIREYVESFPAVQRADTLMLDNFGPNEIIGSVKIEVADTMTARAISELSRKIEAGVRQKFNVTLVVGINAVNETGAFGEMRRKLEELTRANPSVISFGGFYGDEDARTVYFNLLLQFKCDGENVQRQIVEQMKEAFPAYTFEAESDYDYEG